MAEPTATGFFGIKYLTLIAGFAGGVISLSFVRTLSRWQMPFAVLAGLATAAFVAPAIAEYFKWSANVEAALGFVFGITGMSIVPGVIRLAEAFSADPLGTLKALWTRKNGGE